MDASENTSKTFPKTLPAIAIRDVVLFPHMALPLSVDRPKSVAAIYGIVFASPAPLSFAEIEARLDISKGSVSQGLRILREVGALKEVSKDDDRAELFTPDLEMRKLVQRFLENRLQKQLVAGSSRLDALVKAIPGKNGEAAELRRRLQSLQDWHAKARKLLPLAKTFLKLTSG